MCRAIKEMGRAGCWYSVCQLPKLVFGRSGCALCERPEVSLISMAGLGSRRSKTEWASASLACTGRSVPLDANVTGGSPAFIVSPLVGGSVSSSLLLMILCTSYGVFSPAVLPGLGI